MLNKYNSTLDSWRISKSVLPPQAQIPSFAVNDFQVSSELSPADMEPIWDIKTES